MTSRINITITDEDKIDNLEDALGWVEQELDAEVSRSRGRPASDEISMEEAINELALAYSGKK